MYATTRPVAEPWPSSGYGTLDRDRDGWLVAGEEYFRHLLNRPELVPVDDSCANERALHDRLLQQPSSPIGSEELERIADRDAAENYRYFAAFRDLLRNAGTIEGAYIRLIDPNSQIEMPAYFAQLLAQLVVRGLLQTEPTPLAWRVAELFFRTQNVSVETGVLLADREFVDRRRGPRTETILGALIRDAAGAGAEPHGGIEVLGSRNESSYWARSEHHDLALDMTPKRNASVAFAKLCASWLYHFHRLSAQVESVAAIEGDWSWHIGLDAESSGILNALYKGHAVDDSTRGRLLGLFEMQLEPSHHVLATLRGRPIYLGLAMDDHHQLRLKPQNLLINLPLREVD